ncbi:MAG: hypothetical protein R3E63_04420 [Pseudomonadales bacterium]
MNSVELKVLCFIGNINKLIGRPNLMAGQANHVVVIRIRAMGL